MSIFTVPRWVYDLKKKRGDGVRVVRDEFVLMIFVRELGDPTRWTLTLDTKPEGRGAHAVSFIRQGFAKIFTETEARAIIGGIANSNVGCLKMVSLVQCGGELTDHGEFSTCIFTREAFMEKLNGEHKRREDEEQRS